MHDICSSSKLSLFATRDCNWSHDDGVVYVNNRKHPVNYMRYSGTRRPETLPYLFLRQVRSAFSPERRTVASSFPERLEANVMHVAGDKRVSKSEAQKPSQKVADPQKGKASQTAAFPRLETISVIKSKQLKRILKRYVAERSPLTPVNTCRLCIPHI